MLLFNSVAENKTQTNFQQATTKRTHPTELFWTAEFICSNINIILIEIKRPLNASGVIKGDWDDCTLSLMKPRWNDANNEHVPLVKSGTKSKQEIE